MDLHHRTWNARQHLLQDALKDPVNHPEWLSLFLGQHAQLHSGRLSGDATWSFEDDVLAGLNETAMRTVPSGCEHSIAWILWHLARCEDVTMNVLVAGTGQVLDRQDWVQQINTPINHTGNAMNEEEIYAFSQAIDLDALLAYRTAVGLSTRQLVSRLSPQQLAQQVDPARISIVRQSGAVLRAAQGIVDYWSKRSVAGLLLMPPTRHGFTHLNEALRIKNKHKRAEHILA